MKQIIRELSEKMVVQLESQREWVRNHFTPESINEYETIEGKIKLLDTILKSEWIEKTETLKFQCLGVTLGDIIVQELNFKWVEVEDEYGIDPAIKLKGTSIILFPLTMISKRIEKNEKINFIEFYDSLIKTIEEIKRKTNVC